MFKLNSTMHKSKARNNQLMKKYTTLALIGAIVVGVAGLISIDAISATSLVSMQGASDFHESGLMIGHVTYEVRGADGQVKHYMQGDNFITRTGTDCAATAIFDSTDDVCVNVGNFAYIAIGNATGVFPLASATDTALDTDGGGGEIARSQTKIDAVITPNSGAGTIVTLTTPTAFSFNGLGLPPTGTTVTQSGLFNATSGGSMFAIKDLPPVAPSLTGVEVLPADTLSVTWTITLTA